MTARERLRAMATAAGYSPLVLAMLADAVMPSFRIGRALETAQLQHVSCAVEVAAQAGLSDADVRELVPAFQRRGGDWRTSLWRILLARANRRFNDPQRFGVSPVCHVTGQYPPAFAPTPATGAPSARPTHTLPRRSQPRAA